MISKQKLAGTIVTKQSNMSSLDEMDEFQIEQSNAYVWAWGKNKYGELSLGVTQNAILPR